MPTKLNDCACCEGITAIVPGQVFNRPGLSQVRYRIGTQVEFLRSALAALSDPEFSALRSLTTRDTDDFTIALLDSWATLADVLTFYQERIANESWLRTATERDSILRLAQLIGYRLKPGVAAETRLSFFLDETPGAPTEVPLEIGTRVQSVPGTNEKAQTFETVEEINGRVEWNAIKPQTTKEQKILFMGKELFLSGTDTQLHPGDAILIVGAEREKDSSSERWDFRILQTVDVDPKQKRTRVTWLEGLGHVVPHVAPAAQNPKVYALRQRAALFGHNAPDPRLLSKKGTELTQLTEIKNGVRQWKNFNLNSAQIDLDATYPKILLGSWIVLVSPTYVELCNVQSLATTSRADFSLTAKVTRITPDILEHASAFDLRNTLVFAQSESFVMSEQPVTALVTGAAIDLAQPPADLVKGQWLVASGKDSTTGELTSELVQISAINGAKLTVTPALKKSYIRVGDKPEESFSFNANVARATHGETVSEILGSGDGSKANLTFKLKQAPALTYTRSTAPGGMGSSLQIRVNDLLWHEVPSLFGHGSRERVFTTDMADDGSVTVRFGDGVRGARLPSGAQNVKATYRRGSGLDGLVRAGQLTSLLTRPPGLKSVLNPFAAEGADEPESFTNAQQNAPLTVLTLERVVSLEDYENFSRSYAGIAKALATWTWDGRTRGVFLTLAAPLGAPVSNLLITDLITAIHAAGDPFVPVRAVSYQKRLFKVAGKIKIDPDYEAEKVLAAANDTLRDTFSFGKRQFGQPVNLSEVTALVQAVEGVVAVDVDSLYRTGQTVKLNSRLEAELPHGGDPASLGAAELLTLDPAPIDLEVMP
jgi:hypothetical protein